MFLKWLKEDEEIVVKIVEKQGGFRGMVKNGISFSSESINVTKDKKIAISHLFT